MRTFVQSNVVSALRMLTFDHMPPVVRKAIRQQRGGVIRFKYAHEASDAELALYGLTREQLRDFLITTMEKRHVR